MKEVLAEVEILTVKKKVDEVAIISMPTFRISKLCLMFLTIIHVLFIIVLRVIVCIFLLLE